MKKEENLVNLKLNNQISETLYNEKYNKILSEREMLSEEKINVETTLKSDVTVKNRLVEFQKLLTSNKLLTEFDRTFFESVVEKIIVVSVTEEVQLERLMERNNFTEEEAKARIATQIPVKEKESLANAVIYNNGPLEDTAIQLQNILYEWNVLK